MLQFLLVTGFGIIHGLGFAGSVIPLLSDGQELVPILGFNLGVETAQIVVVVAILLFNLLIENVLNIKKGKWVLFSMGGACSLALLFIFENKIW